MIGGLVGQAINTKISLSSNTAQIIAETKSAIGTTRAGGLCGEFNGNIKNCYNLGNVITKATTESPYAGGIAGNNKGNITKSYNSGKVKSEGSDMSLSDVYAGGITAIGETESSVIDCAVMSPEISVTIGWVNTGHKYIIANGGNKINNISINNITGSPTNDSNFRYTQEELKTVTPYNWDFSNTWSIELNTNNGYPYLARNMYAIDTNYENIPNALKLFIDNNYISINDLKQTNDGFTLCTKSLKEILSCMGIEKLESNETKVSLNNLDDWYIFNIGTSYSILKMRGVDEKNIGTSIPFMDFDIDLINMLHEDVVNQVKESVYEKQLCESLSYLIYGKVKSDYSYCVTIGHYFSKFTSQANHLIAEEYIKKILSKERDVEGYIKVPSGLSNEQRECLLSIPDIYDAENNTIRVKNYNLSNAEKCAILVSHSGNKSLNNYAAENICHAMATEILAPFLRGNEDSIIINDQEISRVVAEKLYQSAIKADAGIGEETFSKNMFPIINITNTLINIFGDV